MSSPPRSRGLIAALLAAALGAPAARSGAQAPPAAAPTAAKATVPARTVAEFPVGTFLESVAVATEGALYVASYPDGRVLRVTPAGASTTVATVDGKIAGLALAPDGALLVTGWAKGTAPAVFRVTPSGAVETLVALPGVHFPNSIVRLTGTRYLVADSYRGAIWEVDATRRTASVWLEHPLLARATPARRTPGVNGLRIYRNTLYASNTDRKLLLRIPLVRGGGRPGAPSVWVRGENVDDFAFDARGNLYAATHVRNTVVRVAPDGRVTIVAGPAEGVTGSTAVAFGRAPGDSTGLYVVTNGGLSNPPPGGPESAKVVRLETAAAAAAPRRGAP